MNLRSEFKAFAKSNGIKDEKIDRFLNAYINPTIIEERQMNMTQMDVFSRLMMERIIFLGTPINDDVANIIQAQLLFLSNNDPNKEIKMYINSPGGSVYAGLGIYDTMQYINCDVSTVCTGLAASMGAVLLAGGTQGKRSALKHARIMIHQPLGGAEGQASDIEIVHNQMKIIKNELYLILAEHTGQTLEKINHDSDRDYWMKADEAKEYGMIDEVIVREENVK